MKIQKLYMTHGNIASDSTSSVEPLRSYKMFYPLIFLKQYSIFGKCELNMCQENINRRIKSMTSSFSIFCLKYFNSFFVSTISLFQDFQHIGESSCPKGIANLHKMKTYVIEHISVDGC